MRATRRLVVLGATSLVAIAAGCIVKPAPVVVGQVRGCDLANRAWQQSSPGPCAFSTWRFVGRQDGSYTASESGCAGATGVARWDGANVTLDFHYAGGAGRYQWPLDSECRGGTGQVTWSSGPAIGQSATSTLAQAP